MIDSKIIHTGEYNTRVLELEINNKKIVTPTYFPSISSAATRLQLSSLIQICVDNNYPRLLVSAYDLDHLDSKKLESVSKTLSNFCKKNILFLDSGTFESYWLYDKEWTFAKYQNLVKNFTSDFFTSFDVMPSLENDDDEIYQTMKKYSVESSALEKNNHCITIGHGNSPDQVCNVVSKIIKENSIKMLAIPERDCGKTLHDKISTIKKIRNILDITDPSCILHILGCGNPLTITLFSMAGADMFDSVDWSRWAIEGKSLKFNDLNHLDLLDCDCRVCGLTELDPTVKALLHNLMFYQEYLLEFRTSILENNLSDFLEKYLDRKTISKIVNYF